jgi:glycosyltransferase involved in cell wall biosynthesis
VDKKYKPYFNILIAGSPGKRKGMNFLQNLQSILSLESDINWRSASEPGWGLQTLCEDASNLTLAYSWADLLVVPSELEGAHTGTLEALKSGLKVLTRPTGWAYSELRNLVEIRNTEEEMAQVIIGLKSQKMDGLTLATKELNNMGFSYDYWKAEHSKLFSSFSSS